MRAHSCSRACIVSVPAPAYLLNWAWPPASQVELDRPDFSKLLAEGRMLIEDIQVRAGWARACSAWFVEGRRGHPACTSIVYSFAKL